MGTVSNQCQVVCVGKCTLCVYYAIRLRYGAALQWYNHRIIERGIDMNAGIDYGMGKTNIDQETGIRYGVINQGEVL